MGDDKLVEALSRLLDSNLWKIMALFMTTYLVTVLLRDAASTVVDYILVKTDLFGVGSCVEYDGRRATIVSIGLRRTKLHLDGTTDFIYIKTNECKNLLLVVPTINK